MQMPIFSPHIHVFQSILLLYSHIQNCQYVFKNFFTRLLLSLVHSACRTQNISVMLFDRFHRSCHTPCFPMLVVIRCLPAVLMVNHDRYIHATRIFANNPTVSCVIGKEFNVPLRFPYDGEVILPDQFFLFIREHNFSFLEFQWQIKRFNDCQAIVKKRCKIRKRNCSRTRKQAQKTKK